MNPWSNKGEVREVSTIYCNSKIIGMLLWGKLILTEVLSRQLLCHSTLFIWLILHEEERTLPFTLTIKSPSLQKELVIGERCLDVIISCEITLDWLLRLIASVYEIVIISIILILYITECFH